MRIFRLRFLFGQLKEQPKIYCQITQKVGIFWKRSHRECCSNIYSLFFLWGMGFLNTSFTDEGIVALVSHGDRSEYLLAHIG